MNIAVVGAGISGLLTAYILKTKYASKDISVTIFEKSDRLGGNAYSVNFNVGQPESKSTPRWADLGVNDFNLSSYKNIACLFKDLNVPTAPLEDSTAFSTLDGSVAYVIDPGYKAGSKTDTNMPSDVQAGFDRFAYQAPKDLNDPTFDNFSIEQYIQCRNENPPSGYCGSEDYYPEAFVNYNLYPRINGMYFVHDTVPQTMSFQGIMHYYSLQEGFGGDPPNRVYIPGGTQRWIADLEEALKSQGVRIMLDTSVEVFGGEQGATIRVDGEGNESFDVVVIACHASTALKLIKTGITDAMLQVLSQFDYYNSVSVAHTYAPLLPPDKNVWRTYNILIHGNHAQLRPYTISYVCNRHQNDADIDAYNYFGGPEFFVTLDPAIPIPDRHVLRQTDENGEKPAVATFAHNIVSTQTMWAQRSLWGSTYPEKIDAPPQSPTIQGQNCLYYTGGWTLGAGLHEECYLSAEQVAKLIMGEPLDHDLFYTPESDPEQYAPRYIRETVSQSQSCP